MVYSAPILNVSVFIFLGVSPVLLLRELGADFLPSSEHRAVDVENIATVP